MAGAPARGTETGDYIQTRFQYFSDNNDVEVLTSTTSFGATLLRWMGLTGTYTTDGITGASRRDIRGAEGFDGITAASPDTERRHEIRAELSLKSRLIRWLPRMEESGNHTDVTIGGIYGTEPDYRSQTALVSLTQELFDETTIASVLLSRSNDRFRPAERFIPYADQGWNFLGNGKRITDRVSGSISQVLSATTLVTLTSEYAYDRGYLSRPYHVYGITGIDPATGDTIALFYPESAPQEKRSVAGALQLTQYIPAARGASVVMNYRYYEDSWDIRSHTLAVSLNYRFAGNVIVSPTYRFYKQSASFFYSDVYASVPDYLTTDFRLGMLRTNSAGVTLSFELEHFMKPLDIPYVALFPVSLDIGANYMMRSGTSDPVVRDTHYNYWPVNDGYRGFWIQSGIRCAF